ncbi:MAG: hypothetical protein N3D11_13100 [Candidatus Sumerlaeia bacterium]|nr:hypothetical protein [Candidatus Sumerlaeia bacterium]
MARSHVLQGLSLRSFCVLLCFIPVAKGMALDISFTTHPPGYVAGRLPLGTGNSAHALARDPENENYIYAAGLFDGVARIVRINLWTAARTTVFVLPTSITVSGFAVLHSRALFISDAWHDKIFRLHDKNPPDGDFNDPGEVSELIQPIYRNPGGDWTGTTVFIIPSDNSRLTLKAGTVLFQSEDGGTTQGEVLAVANALTTPTYVPPYRRYFWGFNYGGGLGLDAQGRLLVASSFWPDTGKVWICEDLDGNREIGPGESNILVPRVHPTTEWAGLSALAVDSSGRVYSSVGWGFGNSAQTDIRTFTVPANPLQTTATVSTFATLNSPYLSAVIFNSTTRSFAPGAVNGAFMILLGFDPFYGDVDYLLTLRPDGPSLAVRRWSQYK